MTILNVIYIFNIQDLTIGISNIHIINLIQEAAFKMLHNKVRYYNYYNPLAPVKLLSSEQYGH